MLTDNLCMGCMRELGEEKVCPHCGLHADFVQESPLLPLRTVINDRYIIGKANISQVMFPKTVFLPPFPSLSL